MSGFVTVSVRQGALRGRRRKTPSGGAFLSFQGIPYAKPPLGSLRFKAPLPAEPWTGIRDATKEGNQSVQYDPAIKGAVGDEDCLVLNVFTPRLPSGKDGDKPLAVLVWIHGGGFTLGSTALYDPEPFMDQDVVFVSMHYRLGPLGFLNLGTEEAPGNAGLKDQTMSLRWVKENIAVFGGDPNNVTIFGESAGGASVHYQVLSPLSKGLFRRAIAQSGSALCGWALARDAAGRAKRLALAAGCDAAAVDDPEALLRWFRKAPAQKLVEALEAAISPEERRHGVLFTFVPSVEPALPGAFLRDEPARLLAGGAVPRTPIVFGITSHEGILFLPGAMARLVAALPSANGQAPADTAALDAAAVDEAAAKELAEIAEDLERLLPYELLQGRRSVPRSRQLSERVRDFYFDGKQLTEDTLDGLVHIYTDVHFALGVLRAARDHARLGAPVHVYEFAFEGRLDVLGACASGGKVKGVCHGGELPYMFSFPGLPAPAEGSDEAVTRNRLLRMWADYAKGGNPTPSVDDVITTTWLPFSENAPNYLKIDRDLQEDTALLKERMLFWKDLVGK